MQVAASTPQATGWLPAVGPDVPELLAVEALRWAILSPVSLHPNHNVALAVQLKDFFGLRRFGL
jgi:hypothetical protein